MKKNRKKYLAKYYLKNKPKISNTKTEKYFNNTAYRNDALLRSRIQLVMKILNTMNRSKVKFNGNTEKTYHLSDMSEIVNRSTQLLRIWTRDGTMPEPLFKDNRDSPLYTESQVLFIQALLKKVDLGEYFTFDDLKSIFKNVWDKTFSIKKLEDIIKYNRLGGLKNVTG